VNNLNGVNNSHPKRKVHTPKFTPENITSEQFQFLLTELKKIQEQNSLLHCEISKYLKEKKQKNQTISELTEKIKNLEQEKSELIENWDKNSKTKKTRKKRLNHPKNLKPYSPEW
jgi:predicted  nucleic acid-binding Zn-ribbon protein